MPNAYQVHFFFFLLLMALNQDSDADNRWSPRTNRDILRHVPRRRIRLDKGITPFPCIRGISVLCSLNWSF